MKLPNHIVCLLEECCDPYKVSGMSSFAIVGMCRTILEEYNKEKIETMNSTMRETPTGFHFDVT